MKKIVYFFIFSFLILTLMQSKSKAFADSVYWSMSSNNDISIIWEAGMRYRPCSIAGCSNPSPIWYPLVSRTGIPGVNRYVDGTNTVSGGTSGYQIQWGTSCIDPIVQASQYDCGVSASCYYIPTADVTAPNPANAAMSNALNQFVAGGGGQIDFGNSFSDMSNCPGTTTPPPPQPPPSQPPPGASAVVESCGSATTARVRFSWGGVSGATSYDMYVSPWSGAFDYQGSATNTLVPLADNQTINWNVRGVNSAGNGPYTTRAFTIPDCPATPPPPSGGNCDFSTPERKMIDSCTYQTCQPPSPGSWGPNQRCAPGQALTPVGNAFKYSCTPSTPGSCPATQYTCQACTGNTCTSFTQPSPCSTNCGACPPGGGGSC